MERQQIDKMYKEFVAKCKAEGRPSECYNYGVWLGNVHHLVNNKKETS